MTWKISDPQGNEAGKIRWEVIPYLRGTGLDIGCGPSKVLPQAIGIDNCVDTELFGVQMKPDVVVKDCCDLSDAVNDASVDYVFSSHLLEHVVDPLAALKEWWRCLKVGGYLVLYLPHRDYYPNVGQPGANPDHKHDFCPAEIMGYMREVDPFWMLEVCQERNEGYEYSFLIVFRKRSEEEAPGGHGFASKPAKHEKTACVVRYGGFGDQIQASNILPELKRQGYHVTFMTTPKGQDIVRHDPHIDAWFIQDDNQVPNGELMNFWAYHAKRFDKFINLSESVEGSLLALPGRANHMWPDSMRRKVLGVNYLEFTADIAELPYHSEARFYATDAEKQWAHDYLHALIVKETKGQPFGFKTPQHFTILWALSGSSMHKFYPWQDVSIRMILDEIPEARIIFNGDFACEILESGWENEPRIQCESGKMSIRQTLALAQAVDLVIGPETGVLNAVGFENNAKIVFLSHSSKENLTKHWVNTTTLEPVDTACYPCHRLHYGRDFCHEHEDSGAAMCQASIAPQRVFDAVDRHLADWKLLTSTFRVAA